MSTPYVGEIRMFAGDFPPNGWLYCEGQLLSIAEYEVLFQLIGTTYGGDGQTTFALPDLRGRVPLHMGQGPGLSNRLIGGTGGVEAVTLTQNDIPPHTHLSQGTSAEADRTNPKNALPARSFEPAYAPSGTSVTLSSPAVGMSGGDQPHTNVQPYRCVNFIISLFGIFPSQT